MSQFSQFPLTLSGGFACGKEDISMAKRLRRLSGFHTNRVGCHSLNIQITCFQVHPELCAPFCAVGNALTHSGTLPRVTVASQR